MVVSNGNLLFQGSIYRGYVSFREGTKLLSRPCLYWHKPAITSFLFLPPRFGRGANFLGKTGNSKSEEKLLETKTDE